MIKPLSIATEKIKTTIYMILLIKIYDPIKITYSTELNLNVQNKISFYKKGWLNRLEENFPP